MGGSDVANAPSLDHEPANPWDSARTRQVYELFGVRATGVVHCVPLTRPESCARPPLLFMTWKRYCSVKVALSTVALVAARVTARPPSNWPFTGDCTEGAPIFGATVATIVGAVVD